VDRLDSESNQLAHRNDSINQSLRENEVSANKARADAIELNRQQADTLERLQRIIAQKDDELKIFRENAAKARKAKAKNSEDALTGIAKSASTKKAGAANAGMAIATDLAAVSAESTEAKIASLSAKRVAWEAERQRLIKTMGDEQETIAIDPADLPTEPLDKTVRITQEQALRLKQRLSKHREPNHEPNDVETDKTQMLEEDQTIVLEHTLYYVHDPMCSWCWGFRPTWEKLKRDLPDSIRPQYVLGGLAPDTTEPMPEPMQQMLQQTWHRIAQTVPGTQFNHAFWTQNKPRRATYPACRAVLSANAQSGLIELAANIGCDVNTFKESLNAQTTIDALHHQIAFSRRLGAQGFPSLFFEAIGKTPTPLALSYSDTVSVFEQIDIALAA